MAEVLFVLLVAAVPTFALWLWVHNWYRRLKRDQEDLARHVRRWEEAQEMKRHL